MGRHRGHGEGTIRQLKSGIWVCTIMEGYKPDGRVNYVKVYANTRRELTNAVEDYRNKKRTGEAKKDIPPFRVFSAAWWERHRLNLRRSSQDSCSYTLKKLQQYWRDTPLDQITASTVQDMMIHFYGEEQLSKSYLSKLRGMMHQIMRAAEADDLIRRNPVAYVVFRPQNKSDAVFLKNVHKKDAFMPSEVQLIYAAQSSQIRDGLLILIGVGLRTQEVLALRGRHIGPNGCSIRVEEAVNMEGSKPVVGATKNVASVREVPVPEVIQPIVAKYANCGDCLIWESGAQKGQPINPSTFRNQAKKFCNDIGIRSLTPHCGRHTCITQLRAHGVDPEVVKCLVGHTRNDVTEGYNHIPKEVLMEAMNRLNDLFANKKTDPKRSA